MEYKFTSEDIKKAEDFASAIDVNYYSGRDQLDDHKKRLDQKFGKLGELAVYSCLKSKYSDITEPDFKIYNSSQKNWDYDLKSSSFNLHVKSQNVIQTLNGFPTSWIFQAQDQHIFSDFLEKDFVAFVIVNLIKKTGTIKGIVSLKQLHDNKLFKMPVKENLRNANKLAVYYDDLESTFPDNLCQL